MNKDTIIKTAFFIVPLLFSGASNMIFMKLPILNSLRKPMDGGKRLWDGERLFGDNKTWKGFIGMILVTTFWFSIYGLLYSVSDSIKSISLVQFNTLIFPYNAWTMGFAMGLGYVLFELPNSFIKRRLKVDAGTNASGLKGKILAFFDQCDSVIGTVIFLFIFYVPTPMEILFLFIFGTGFHYIVNILLYFAGLKKQAG